MKVLIVGDAHFRHQLPYSTALPDGRASEWEGVKTFLKELSQDCGEIVLMGDNLNSKHNHSSVNSEFVQFLHGFGNKRIHMLVGNHERYGHSSALDFIKETARENWLVYDVISHVEIGGKDVLMLPFLTAGVLGAKDLVEAQQKLTATLKGVGGMDYLFHHHVSEGTIWSQTADTEDLHEVLVAKEVFPQFKKVIGGHIHKRAWVTDNVLVTGNLFTNEVGEHDKAVFILDTETNEITEHKVPCRGIFKVEVREAAEIPEDIPDASIVKVTVVDPALQGAGVTAIRELCERFDAYVLVEQYPRKRKRIQISEAGALDFSLDNLIKVYAEARKVPHTELKMGLELLEQ